MSARTLAPNRVLLVDRDVDELAALGSVLRQRGFHVVLANGPRMAQERLSAQHFHVILVAEDTLHGSDLALDVLVRGALPPHLVLVASAEAAWEKNEVPRADIDVVVGRITELLQSLRAKSDPPDIAHERSGRLADGSILSLVQTHVDERSTGVLSVTTPEGAGELRFARGELVDAVYLRLDGVKAFLRLALENDGDWVFTETTPLVMRRITSSTSDLLRSAPGRLERMGALHHRLGDLQGWTLIAEPPAPGAVGPLAFEVTARLSRPRGLGSLLDESAESDEDVLTALVEIDAAGLLKRVKADGHSVAFASPEQIDLVSAHTARARSAGFAGPSRIVFAATSATLARFAHAATRLDEAERRGAPTGDTPTPYEMATLRVQDDAAVELVGVPLDAAYSPLWPLVLAGAAAVVALDGVGGPEADYLKEICASSTIPFHGVGTLRCPLDSIEPHHVASLVRTALGAEASDEVRAIGEAQSPTQSR
jgi:CheY-like chemotaxis protein